MDQIRLLTTLSALTAILLLSGCAEKTTQPGDESTPEPVLMQVTFKAVSPVSWNVGDHVAVFDDVASCSDFTVKSIGFGGKTAVLSGKIPSNPERTRIEIRHPFDEGQASLEDYFYKLPSEQYSDKYTDYILLEGGAEVDGDDFTDVTVSVEEKTLFLDVRITNPSLKEIDAVKISATDTVTTKLSSTSSEASIKARFVLLPSEVSEYEVSIVFSNNDIEVFRIPAPGKASAGARLEASITVGEGVYKDIVEQGWYYGEPFKGVPDIYHMKIYEASPRAFASSNSLKAITARLDEIAELGANTLWIMPIFEQSEVRKPYGSPYSMKDFYKISPEYGTVEDLRKLIEKAHSLGIAVLLDYITNHTGADCSWVSEHPTWYLEQYAPDYTDAALFKWNDPDPDLEKQMQHVLEYWIHAVNNDGYRCDTVDPERSTGVTLSFFTKAISGVRQNCPGRDLIFIAESAKPECLTAGFNLNFGWHFVDMLELLFQGKKKVKNLFSVNTEEWEGVAKYGNDATTRMRYCTHSDYAAKNSPLQIYNSLDGSYAAFVLASTMGGVPLIYSSQEIGYPVKLSFFKTAAVVMDWTSGKSTSETYKTLFRLGDSMTLRKGSITRIANDDVVSFTREYEGETILVLVNVINGKSSCSLPDSLQNASWKDYFTGDSIKIKSDSLSAYEYKVLVKQ